MSPTPQTLAEHAAFVRALAHSLVRDSHAAEDVVQDTWLATIERPPAHGANPRAWLARLVERFAWRRGRSSARRRTRETAVARPEREDGVDETLARAEVLRRVTAAVLALAEPYQATVLLRFYEGLDAHAIAARTDTPVATVRSRLQRALAQLREELDREHGGDRRAWCVGLVSLVGGNRAVEIAGGGAGGAAGASPALGTGVGVATMSLTAKVALGAAAAAIVGFFLWRGTRGGGRAAGDPVALRDEALASLDENAAQGSPPLASPAPSAERQALAPLGADPVAARGALAIRVAWARDGRPAAGEELSMLAWRHAAGDRTKHGFTSEEGRFLLEGLLPGRVDIETSHGAYASAEISAGETTNVDLENPRGFTARGRVVDLQGLPVAGARLWLSTYGSYESGFVVGATRQNGTFELVEVPEARYLGAIAEGYAPSHLDLLAYYQAIDDPLSDAELTLTLNGEGGRLALELTRPDGGPAAGAMISLSGSPPKPLRLGNRSLSDIPPFSSWSDERGVASIDGFPPGQAEIAVYAAEMGVWKGSTQVEAGRVTTLRIRLQQEGVVVGTVRNGAGEPAAGAKVFLDEEYRPLRPSTTSGSDGRYELRGLPLGDVRLKAYVKELGSALTSARIELGSAASWDPVLSTGRVITGRVVDPEGAPLAGWKVNAMLGLHSTWRAQAVTDTEGAFRLVDVKTEPLVFELYRDVEDRIPRLRRNVSETESDLLLRFSRTDFGDATLTGRFLDAQGLPIAQASVALWARGTSSAPGFAVDSQGVLRAEHLPPGVYELTASFPEERPLFLGRVTLASEAVHDLGTIALEAPGTLRLTVNGRSPAESDEFDSFSFRRLDDDGHSHWAARFERAEAGEGVALHPGRYLLQADGKRGVADERVLLELRSGANRAVDLVPRAGRGVLACAEVPAGAPIPDWVRVVVHDAEGNVLEEYTTGTAFERRYTLGLQLVPGTYEFDAEASDGRRAHDSFEVTLESGPATLEACVPLR